MASAKRQLPEGDIVVDGPKKAKGPFSSPRVLLNPADCDLDFNIGCNGLVGYGLHEEGFAYCWSGARANVGITRGRYCFGCKVVSVQLVDMEDTALDQQHICRIGISRGDDMVGNLGESEHSFGYGGTGKISNTGKFLNYGERFGVGDTIICCVDLESKPLASIGFSKNGKWLGTAIQFDAGRLGLGVLDSPLQHLLWKSALFPHVLLKNVVVQMQFSLEDELVPQAGFKPWASAIDDRSMIMGPTLSDPTDCEVIMMVGLPASGKSTWAENWVKEHPEKRYVLLGTNLILDQMKVPGLLRKNNYGERFDRLMDRATTIFNVLLSKAASVPRNYIIDQTNVYKNARKRKLKPFADYQKIAVVVFPNLEELKIRSHKRFKEMGKEVPPDAVNSMIANYVLPKSKDMHHSDEYFDQVIFVELNRDESQKHLDQMKQNLASKSEKNLSSTLSSGGSSQHFIESPLQNYRSSTAMMHFGSGSSGHRQGSYSGMSPSYHGTPNQVNANGLVTELHGSLNSFSGVYPNSRVPPIARAPYASGPYSNNETSWFARDNNVYTYGVIPTDDMNPYSYRNSGVDGRPYSGPNVAGNSMVFPGAFPEPSPIANARTMSLNYSTPYRDERGFCPDMHTPSPSPATFDSLSTYGTSRPRPPPYGSLPDNMRYIGGYASQGPRYA